MITNEAVQWVTRIYGLDICQLKVQATRRRLNPIVDTSIDIPYELLEVQNDVTIAMDGLIMNGLKFLSKIPLNIYFRTIIYMPNTTAVYYQRELNKLNSV